MIILGWTAEPSHVRDMFPEFESRTVYSVQQSVLQMPFSQDATRDISRDMDEIVYYITINQSDG